MLADTPISTRAVTRLGRQELRLGRVGTHQTPESTFASNLWSQLETRKSLPDELGAFSPVAGTNQREIGPDVG